MRNIKYQVKDPKTLLSMIGSSGNSINSFAHKMNASNSYLSDVIYGKKSVGPKYARRVVDLLNSSLSLKNEELKITTIFEPFFFDHDVAKKETK